MNQQNSPFTQPQNSDSNRRQSRELTLQILFQSEFLNNPKSDNDFQRHLKIFRDNFNFSDEVWEYTLHLLNGIQTHKNKLDQLIDSTSENWTTKRMGLVDLNILRTAIFEMCIAPQEDTPAKVIINESLEISKKYGNTDSSKFINGILDNLLVSQKQSPIF